MFTLSKTLTYMLCFYKNPPVLSSDRSCLLTHSVILFFIYILLTFPGMKMRILRGSFLMNGGYMSTWQF